MHTSFNPATLASLSALLILLVPYLTAIFTQDHYPRWVNECIALGVSVLAGVIAFLQSGGSFQNLHDINDLWAAGTVIVLGAKVYYLLLLKSCPALIAIEYITGGKQHGSLPPNAAFAASGVGSALVATVSSGESHAPLA